MYTNLLSTRAEKDQALERVGKVLEFERGKEAALVLGLDEKIMALNKMIFDMGSGSSLPTLRDPTEKINYLGKLLEDQGPAQNYKGEPCPDNERSCCDRS